MNRMAEKGFASRSEVLGRNGMVACSQPLAASAGLEVLQAGGSAVDAAVATNAALGVVEPMCCGIGGDLFAIVWDAKARKLHGLNASGRSPLGLSYDGMRAELKKLQQSMIPPRGMLTISVPGCVDGWAELHARFGKLPMSKLLERSIEYATDGFPVSEVVAAEWQTSIPPADQQYGDFSKVFLPGDKAPVKGQVFRNPALAKTYRILAKEGPAAFYKGEIAGVMDSFFATSGGYLRKTDFQNHKSTWVEPASVSYRGYDVFELPPNGQGFVALQMLNILEAYDLARMGWGTPQTLHLMIEAKKLAFEDRARYYADPDFAKLPLEELISKDYAARRRKLIDMDHTLREYQSGNPLLDQSDTTYIATADREGNMVSLIQSNYRGLGSAVVGPDLGFAFHCRGQLFALEPGHANVYAPGKRPFNTIIPAMVLKDGEPFLCFGVMGGSMQPQGHVQILTNVIDFGMNFQEAGDAPRWQHCGSSEPTGVPMQGGGYVEMEAGYLWPVLRDLRKRGHDLRIGQAVFGGYQAIGRDRAAGVYYGASESRKDGHAVGY